MTIKKNELLSVALNYKPENARNRLTAITEDHIELALAWARGEITQRQVTVALKFGGTAQVYVFLAKALREYVKAQL